MIEREVKMQAQKEVSHETRRHFIMFPDISDYAINSEDYDSIEFEYEDIEKLCEEAETEFWNVFGKGLKKGNKEFDAAFSKLDYAYKRLALFVRENQFFIIVDEKA